MLNSLSPAFVVSLDFELHWGMTERVPGPEHPYNANLYGAREAVRKLLELFGYYGIHATWATVGMLFARGAEDLEEFKPRIRPTYSRKEVDTYRVSTGASEKEDPIHFAPSLLEEIRAVPGQEVGSHTFCHYYCDEPGQDIYAFKADLDAAKAIAARDGVEFQSLVFPRNEVISEYQQELQNTGIRSYRGNPPGGLHHLQASGFRRLVLRALRFSDSFINVTGHNTVPWSDICAEKPSNVRASHFLRPYSDKVRLLEPLRIRRVKLAMRAAAQRGEVYHLWWHPHNFGAKPEENLAALSSILEEFKQLQKQYGMRSLTMSEAAELAQPGSNNP